MTPLLLILTVPLILLLGWVIYYLIKPASGPGTTTLKFILLFTLFAHIVFTFILMRSMDFWNAMILFIAYPIPIFLGVLTANPFADFLAPVILGSLVFALLVFVCSYKKTSNIVWASAAFYPSLIMAVLIAGNIRASHQMEQSAAKHELDCYRVFQNFSDSLIADEGTVSPHAEGMKDGNHYLWSYKKMAFVEIPTKSRYIGHGCMKHHNK